MVRQQECSGADRRTNEHALLLCLLIFGPMRRRLVGIQIRIERSANASVDAQAPLKPRHDPDRPTERHRPAVPARSDQCALSPSRRLILLESVILKLNRTGIPFLLRL